MAEMALIRGQLYLACSLTHTRCTCVYLQALVVNAKWLKCGIQQRTPEMTWLDPDIWLGWAAKMCRKEKHWFCNFRRFTWNCFKYDVEKLTFIFLPFYFECCRAPRRWCFCSAQLLTVPLTNMVTLTLWFPQLHWSADLSPSGTTALIVVVLNHCGKGLEGYSPQDGLEVFLFLWQEAGKSRENPWFELPNSRIRCVKNTVGQVVCFSACHRCVWVNRGQYTLGLGPSCGGSPEHNLLISRWVQCLRASGGTHSLLVKTEWIWDSEEVINLHIGDMLAG